MRPFGVLILIAGIGLAVALPAAPPLAANMLQGQTAAPAGLEAHRHWLMLERDADGLRLSGRVADALTKTVLATHAAALFGADRVENGLTEAPGDESVPADFPRAAMAAAETLSKVASGSAEVTQGAVRVTGLVTAPEEAGRLTRALRGDLPPGIQISTEFSVAVPDIVASLTLSPERCAFLMTRIAAERQILFASGSAEIEEDSLPGLETIASLFERCPGAEIEVLGYTDSEGPEDYNLDLSQARAEAVMQRLLDRGVPLRRLRARGFGEADPIASNETEAGRARNRRIEFRAVE